MIWHKNQTWPTPAERARERAARKLGCVLSRNRAARGLPVPEPRKGSLHIHHLLKPGKRYGHGYSIPLHSWYHEAIIPYPYTSKTEARKAFGASIKHGSKAFLADHGVTEWELYDDTQRELKLPIERPPTKIMPRRLPSFEREPPHCPSCECGMEAPQTEALVVHEHTKGG